MKHLKFGLFLAIFALVLVGCAEEKTNAPTLTPQNTPSSKVLAQLKIVNNSDLCYVISANENRHILSIGVDSYVDEIPEEYTGMYIKFIARTMPLDEPNKIDNCTYIYVIKDFKFEFGKKYVLTIKPNGSFTTNSLQQVDRW